MIDTTGKEMLDFWNRYKVQEEQERKEQAKQQELIKDGLGYINPDANNGSNNPINPVILNLINIPINFKKILDLYSGNF